MAGGEARYDLSTLTGHQVILSNLRKAGLSRCHQLTGNDEDDWQCVIPSALVG